MTYETLKTRGDWSIEFCTCLSFCFGFLFTLPLAPNSAGINLGGEISQPSHWISCNAKPNLPIPLCGLNAGRNGSGVNGRVGAKVNAGVSGVNAGRNGSGVNGGKAGRASYKFWR